VQSDDFKMILPMYAELFFEHVFDPRLPGCRLPGARKQLKCSSASGLLAPCTCTAAKVTSLSPLLPRPRLAQPAWLRPGSQPNPPREGQRWMRGTEPGAHHATTLTCVLPLGS